MVQNRKILTWMLLALFAVLSLASSFSTVLAKNTANTISLQIHLPSNSTIKSVTIHDQTQNIQKCFTFTSDSNNALGTVTASGTVTTFNPSSTSDILTVNVASYYKATDSLHIQLFLKAGCKGKSQKSIVGGLIQSSKKPLLLGCGKNSLENQTQSTQQVQDGLDLEETTAQSCLQLPPTRQTAPTGLL